MKMDYTIDCLHFCFTPSLYNHFVNISSAFYLSEDDEGWGELSRNRADILKAQRMIGMVQMRGERLKQYWYRYYCCLSLGYLYFYEGNRQEFPSTYFYLKNTEVIDGKDELKIDNTLILKSKVYKCCLAFKTSKECEKWKKEIEEVIKEISIFTEVAYKRPTEVVNKHDVSNEMKIVMKKFVVEIFEESKKDFVSFGLTDTECKVIIRPEDMSLGMKINSLEMYHPSNKHYKKILEVSKNVLVIDIDMVNKNSPRFKGELLIVQVNFDNLIAYYPPKVIKQLMIILLDIAPKTKLKTVKEEEEKGEILNPAFTETEIVQKYDTCKEAPEVYFKMTVKLNNAKLYCLHQGYDSLLYLFDIESANFEYSILSDHYLTCCKLGTNTLYDLTNYPNTISPSNFFNESAKPQRLMQMLPYEGYKKACKADIVNYLEYCPDKPSDRMSTTKAYIRMMKIDFYNECVSFRFMDYFFYQLLTSLSPRDYTAESLKIYKERKKPHEGKDIYEIVYFTPFGAFEIIIEKLLIYLKPRFHYKDYFLIDLGEVRLWNKRQMSAKRWVKYPTKEVLCEWYNVDMSAFSISFNEKFIILDPCHFVLKLGMICVEAHDYNNHNPAILDQSNHIEMETPKRMKLNMKPEHYTYLLKCLDLNINYTDNLSDSFNFRPLKLDIIQGGIKFIMEGKFSNISFFILNSDRSILSELIMKKVDIYWRTNNNYTKIINVKANSLYCLHEANCYGYKDTIIAPLSVSKLIQTDDVFYSDNADTKQCVDITLKVLEQWDKEWDVKLTSHKILVELYFIMLLSHFFIEGFPDYKQSPEQPNECNLVY